MERKRIIACILIVVISIVMLVSCTEAIKVQIYTDAIGTWAYYPDTKTVISITFRTDGTVTRTKTSYGYNETSTGTWEAASSTSGTFSINGETGSFSVTGSTSGQFMTISIKGSTYLYSKQTDTATYSTVYTSSNASNNSSTNTSSNTSSSTNTQTVSSYAGTWVCSSQNMTIVLVAQNDNEFDLLTVISGTPYFESGTWTATSSTTGTILMNNGDSGSFNLSDNTMAVRLDGQSYSFKKHTTTSYSQLAKNNEGIGTWYFKSSSVDFTMTIKSNQTVTWTSDESGHIEKGSGTWVPISSSQGILIVDELPLFFTVSDNCITITSAYTSQVFARQGTSLPVNNSQVIGTWRMTEGSSSLFLTFNADYTMTYRIVINEVSVTEDGTWSYTSSTSGRINSEDSTSSSYFIVSGDMLTIYDDEGTDSFVFYRV